MNEVAHIYRITCTQNQKSYIGQTVDLKSRKRDHFRLLKQGRHYNKPLQRAYNKYSELVFKFDVLERNIPFSQINDREKYWIAHFDSYLNGYNQNAGGSDVVLENKIPCIWNGIKYESIAQAARANRLTLGGMKNRLQLGYKCDDDIENYRTVCIWNNIQYSSIAEAARSNNVSSFTMQARINKGHTCDADLNPRNIPKICEWNGIQYSSVAEAAKSNNVSYAQMDLRIRRGHKTDNEVITTNKGFACKWSGIEYASFSEAARANNISTTAMIYRIKKGYTHDDDLLSS